MEIGLGGRYAACYRDETMEVLILVLVEIGLGVTVLEDIPVKLMGLNPCFSGNRFGRANP